MKIVACLAVLLVSLATANADVCESCDCVQYDCDQQELGTCSRDPGYFEYTGVRTR